MRKNVGTPEFLRALEAAIIEGNYSALMGSRIEKATGVILLDSSAILRFFRYLKRTLINRSGRAGHLEGAKDSVKWEMVDWILIKTRNSADRYARLIRATGKPFVQCRTAGQLTELYGVWDLKLPD